MSTFNDLWTKFKEFPGFLQTSIYAFIAVLFLLATFNLAKLNKDVLKVVRSYFPETVDREQVTETVNAQVSGPQPPADTMKALVNILPKKDSIQPAVVVIPPAVAAHSRTGGTRPNRRVVINYESEIAQINILYASSIRPAQMSSIPVKLRLFCENKVSVCDPEQIESVAHNINVIKLPVSSEARRNRIAALIANSLHIRFHVVQQSDAALTVLRIGQL